MCYDVFLIEMSVLDYAETLVMREGLGDLVVLEGLLRNHCALLINESIKLMCVKIIAGINNWPRQTLKHIIMIN